jgi:Holliday junction resolvasome RuvABC endonuclease subunit
VIMAGVLAFDAATLTGWAWVLPSGSTRHGVIDLGNFRGRRAALFDAFEGRVADLVTECTPSLIVYESPFFRGNGTRITFGLAAVIELVAARRELPINEVRPTEIKKHITGKGNADKAAVMKAVRERGFRPTDDNAADAIALAHFAWTNLIGRAA